MDGITSWNIERNIGGTGASTGGPYTTGTYYLYPSAIPTPPSRVLSMGSLFTNNAQVYYKPHSLSTGGGGSGVKNSRHKQRKT